MITNDISYCLRFGSILNKLYVINKAPRRKQRGINFALQSAGFQPAFAPRGGELNPEEIKIMLSIFIRLK
ncbi:hypothetical protein [Nitrosomonas ureae]|uniref:hypothetical protein n=1 Tax=Nitrosomonas ureae TaxID=44577 RepID=UPI0011B0C1B1|nr:hypothetical protein [Nitrosomonas ureae]